MIILKDTQATLIININHTNITKSPLNLRLCKD